MGGEQARADARLEAQVEGGGEAEEEAWRWGGRLAFWLYVRRTASLDWLTRLVNLTKLKIHLHRYYKYMELTLSRKRHYAPIFSKPSQSSTWRFDGRCVIGQTQSIESQVGPQTLLGSRVTPAVADLLGMTGENDRPFVRT